MQHKKTTAILLAVLAAAFYAVNVPVSKLLLKEISPTFLASLLYFGAGIGIGLLYCINPKSHRGEKKLTRKDLPYTLGMILLDIAAPILLMLGLKSASSANASLLGNFEIAATTLIALLLFREKVSKRLWAAILLITLSSGILSFEDMSSLHFSRGSLLGTGEQLHPQYFRQKYFRDCLSQGHLFRTGFVSHCSVHRRAVPRTARCCCGTASGICCLRAEHFLLRPFPEHPRSRQDQCLLCHRPLYRHGPFLHHLARCPDSAVFSGTGGNAAGFRSGGSGHAANGTHPFPHPHVHTHPRRRDTHPHHYPQPPAPSRHARGKSPAPPHHAHAAAFTQLIAAPVTPVRLFPAAARTPARTAPERFPETARFPAAFPAKSGRTIPAEKLP